MMMDNPLPPTGYNFAVFERFFEDEYKQDFANVLATFLTQQWISMEFAVFSKTGATWSYAVYLDSGQFEVFKLFDIDSVLLAKVLINYNNNPSLLNFESSCNAMFGAYGTGWTYTINENGEIDLDINIDGDDFKLGYTKDPNSGDLTYLEIEPADSGVITWQYPQDYKRKSQNQYLIHHFVPSGIRVNINLL